MKNAQRIFFLLLHFTVTKESREMTFFNSDYWFPLLNCSYNVVLKVAMRIFRKNLILNFLLTYNISIFISTFMSVCYSVTLHLFIRSIASVALSAWKGRSHLKGPCGPGPPRFDYHTRATTSRTGLLAAPLRNHAKT